MADIELHRTHHLGLKGARAAADKMAGRLADKFDLAGEWKGNTLHFSRSGVNGQLIVTDHDMNLAITLGFMLKMMKGPIEQSVHEQLDKVLKDGGAKPQSKVVAKPDAKSTNQSPARVDATTASPAGAMRTSVYRSCALRALLSAPAARALSPAARGAGPMTLRAALSLRVAA